MDNSLLINKEGNRYLCPFKVSPLKCERCHRIHVLGGILFIREVPKYIPIVRILWFSCSLIQIGEESYVEIGPYFSRPLKILHHPDSVCIQGPGAEWQLLPGDSGGWRWSGGGKCLQYCHNLLCKLLQGFDRGSTYNLKGSLVLLSFCLVAPSPGPEKAD